MDLNRPAELDSGQPLRKVSFAPGMRKLLVALICFDLFVGIEIWVGDPWATLFLLGSCIGISSWIHPRWSILICVAGGLLSLMVFLSAMSVPPRETIMRINCYTRLNAIAHALHDYHSGYDCFPPAYVVDENGRPMHSWRVLLLPYLDHKDLYDQYDFNEPWNGPSNSELLRVRLPCFNCPKDHEESSPTTNYLAVVGPGTAWPGEESGKLPVPPDFVLHKDDMPIAVTIHVVEVADSGIHWMEPRDLHLGQISLAVNPPTGQGISGHRWGAHVLLLDGTIKFLSDDIPPAVLNAALRIDGQTLMPELRREMLD